MQFLQPQKRNPQSKPLSKSRLRERRRESRELEEVSAFFMPPKAQKIERSRNPYRGKTTKAGLTQNNQHRPVNPARNDKPSSPSIHTHVEMDEYRCRSSELRRLSNDEGAPAGFSRSHTETEPSKATTYFTWSSSRVSPVIHVPENNTRRSPSKSASDWTTTPDSIRRALVDTGVYRDTGIHPYDDTSTMKVDTQTIMHEVEDREGHGKRQRRHKQRPKVSYRDQAVMTDDRQITANKQRYQTGDIRATLKIRRQEGVYQTPQGDHSYEHSLDPEGVDDRSYSEQPRTPDLSHSGQSHSKAMAAHTFLPPDSVDRISHGSREAMPPPPLPPPRNSTSYTLDSHRGGLKGGEQQFYNETIEQDRSESCVEKSSCPPMPSAPTPYSTSNVGAERSVDPINAASWIPQVNTPTASRVQRERNLSRVTMRSPIYQSQVGEQPRGELTSSKKQPQLPQYSMAEFIAKIEREIQVQSSQHNYSPAPLGPSVHSTSTNPSDQSIEYGHELHSDYTDGHWGKEDAGDGLRPQAEASYESIQIRGNVQHPMPSIQLDSNTIKTDEVTGEAVDRYEEERQEMSRFWGPNKFSQF